MATAAKLLTLPCGFPMSVICTALLLVLAPLLVLSQKDFLLRLKPIIHLGTWFIPTREVELIGSPTYLLFKR